MYGHIYVANKVDSDSDMFLVLLSLVWPRLEYIAHVQYGIFTLSGKNNLGFTPQLLCALQRLWMDGKRLLLKFDPSCVDLRGRRQSLSARRFNPFITRRCHFLIRCSVTVNRPWHGESVLQKSFIPPSRVIWIKNPLVQVVQHQQVSWIYRRGFPPWFSDNCFLPLWQPYWI